jgi:HSP20 family protein
MLIMNILFRTAGDVLAQLDRFQHYVDQAARFNEPSDIRAQSGASFPVINLGNTPESVEVMALAPGLDAKVIEVTVDNGLLVIAGKRDSELTQWGEGTSIYANERFYGSFRRVISLPDDVDPANVQATYRDGLLRVTVAKREASKPRRVSVN